MANKNNATCSICGNEYYACLSCRDSLRLQPWKIHTDTAEHYKVFQVVRGFSTGVYDKKEFKSKLKNIDLSDLENYREHIKVLIKDALKEEEIIEQVAETKSAIVEKVKKDEKETPVISMVAPSRKKKYKVEVE